MSAQNSPPEPLTARESEVLALVRRGMTNDAIARELAITRDAVRYHLKEIHSKLGTAGDRDRLVSQGRGPFAMLPALLGGLSARVATAAVVAVLGVSAVGVALSWPAAGMPADAVAPDADGRYPNGCPAAYTTWEGATLEDFGRSSGGIAEVRRLNPGLGDGPFAAGIDVRVPYIEDNSCGTAVRTPAGSTPVQGGTPVPPSGK